MFGLYLFWALLSILLCIFTFLELQIAKLYMVHRYKRLRSTAELQQNIKSMQDAHEQNSGERKRGAKNRSLQSSNNCQSKQPSSKSVKNIKELWADSARIPKPWYSTYESRDDPDEKQVLYVCDGNNEVLWQIPFTERQYVQALELLYGYKNVL